MGVCGGAVRRRQSLLVAAKNVPKRKLVLRKGRRAARAPARWRRCATIADLGRAARRQHRRCWGHVGRGRAARRGAGTGSPPPDSEGCAARSVFGGIDNRGLFHTARPICASRGSRTAPQIQQEACSTPPRRPLPPAHIGRSGGSPPPSRPIDRSDPGHPSSHPSPHREPPSRSGVLCSVLCSCRTMQHCSHRRSGHGGGLPRQAQTLLLGLIFFLIRVLV